jgi:CheY-like chemotaxis protein
MTNMQVRALVVDDQPVIRSNLRLRLTLLGCEVEEAETAHQALRVFKQSSPQLVTLDILMPIENAYTSLDLLRDIRRISQTTDVVIISSTADDREQYLREGAIEFLTKPFDNFAGLARRLQPLVEALSSSTD